MIHKEGNPVFHIDAGVGTYQVSAHGQHIGDDLHVVITGGEQPHVGAVAVGSQSSDEPDGIRVALITVSGHKEDVVVEKVARRLSRQLGITVLVAAGMHWDEINKKGIAQVLEHTDHLTEKILHEVRGD
jgi:hydrogenase maturation factor